MLRIISNSLLTLGEGKEFFSDIWVNKYLHSRKIEYRIYKNLFRIVKIIIVTLLILNTAYASVDHKSSELNTYLKQISGNQLEKSDNFINIIKNNKQGTYLDIGSGRDTIPHIIDNISHNNIGNVKLIAADLEYKTLAEIAKMYPTLLDLDDHSSIKLSLTKMDATEMNKIPDNSVKAINASAILHEVYSYVPIKTSIDRFFLESVRVLEKNGFLIYRDPTLQNDPDTINSLVLTSDFAKKFAILFLPKFLDNKLTKMVDMYGKSIKPNFDYQNKLNITLYLKNYSTPINLSFLKFFSLPTKVIDFNQDITIDAPRRLLSELQRHYILFVKDFYPIHFVNEAQIQLGSSLESITPKSAKYCLKAYTKDLGINFDKNLTKEDIAELQLEKTKIDRIVEEGLYIHITKKLNYNKLMEFFGINNISPDLYTISKNSIYVDAKLSPIIYSHFPEMVAGKDMPIESFNFLHREGEEYYFYYTTEQLLSYLEKFCNYYLNGTSKEGYVLRPPSSGAIKYADRSLYKETLGKDMIQFDQLGKKQEFVTTKTIITLQLLPKTKTKS